MKNISIKVGHLYGNIMNTYGDYGNIIALRYYAKQIGVNVETEVISLGDPLEAEKYDFLLFGGGQDYEEQVLAPDLRKKAPTIKEYVENDGVILAICGGYQMLGDYFVMANGWKVKGSGVLPHYTLNQTDKRFIGNIIIKNKETNETYHGFENHQGRTFLKGDEKPLGEVIKGYGNNGEDKGEGLHYRNVFGSYFHGPILTRNGNLAKRILKIILEKKEPTQNWEEILKTIKTESF